MNSKSVLVTGGTGFVGSHLVRFLVEKGLDVHVLVRPNSKLSVLNETLSACTVHVHDSSLESMKEIFLDVMPSHVFHLASLFVAEHNDSNFRELFESNIVFSSYLAEAMLVSNTRYLINTGTSWQHYHNEEYNPVNLYAATKKAFHDILRYYVEAHDIKVVTLALFDTYGPNDPRQKLFSLLREVSLSRGVLDMSPGDQLIDMVYIDDVVSAFYSAYKNISEQAGGHYYYGVSSSNPVTLKSLVAIFEQVIGNEININWGKRKYRAREVMTPWDAFQTLPGWKPRVSIEEGIRRSL